MTLAASSLNLLDAWSQCVTALVLAGPGAHFIAWTRGLIALRASRPSTHNPQAGQSEPPSKTPLRNYGLGLLIAFLIPALPVGSERLSFAAIMDGITGGFSSLTVMLMVMTFFSGKNLLLPLRSTLPFLALGGLLYMSVLTYSLPDVYRLGYLYSVGTGPGVYLLLLVLCIWAALLPFKLALLLAIATLCWALQLQNSSNLWDYLIDLPTFLVCLVWILGQGLMRLINRKLFT
jgi:hypothetical protein